MLNWQQEEEFLQLNSDIQIKISSTQIPFPDVIIKY